MLYDGCGDLGTLEENLVRVFWFSFWGRLLSDLGHYVIYYFLDRMESFETREYLSLIQTYSDTHTVDGVFLRDEERLLYEEMLRLNDLAPNTPTGFWRVKAEMSSLYLSLDARTPLMSMRSKNKQAAKERDRYADEGSEEGKEPRNESPLSISRHPFPDDMSPRIVYPDDMSPRIVYPDGISPGNVSHVVGASGK
nr:hypothetical protein [Tanacetum cinerariifolium]